MPKRVVVAALIAAAGITLGLAIEVDVWPWDAFVGDWWEWFEPNAERWVAIGTVALAAATFVLALHTRGMARQMSEEVVLTRESIDANVRPVLVDVPIGLFVEQRPPLFTQQEQPVEHDPADIDIFSDERGEITVQVPLRNVGKGIAIMGGPTLEWPGLNHTWRSSTLQTAVPPGESTRLDFAVETGSDEAATRLVVRLHDEDRQFVAEVSYTDVNGGQETRTRAYLEYRGPEDEAEWRVDKLELYSVGDSEPFVTLSGRSVNVAVRQAREPSRQTGEDS